MSEKIVQEVEERYSPEKLRSDLREGRGIALMTAFFAVGFCGLANENFFNAFPGGFWSLWIGGSILALVFMEVTIRRQFRSWRETELRYARKGQRCKWK